MSRRFPRIHRDICHSKMNSLRHEEVLPISPRRKLSLENGLPLVKLLGSKGSTDRFLFIVGP